MVDDINIMNDRELALYWHGQFGNAVKRLQEETDTSEKLLKKELELGRLEFQASKQEAIVRAGELKAGHKYDHIRYKG